LTVVAGKLSVFVRRSRWLLVVSMTAEIGYGRPCVHALCPCPLVSMHYSRIKCDLPYIPPCKLLICCFVLHSVVYS